MIVDGKKLQFGNKDFLVMNFENFESVFQCRIQIFYP